MNISIELPFKSVARNFKNRRQHSCKHLINAIAVNAKWRALVAICKFVFKLKVKRIA